MSDLARLAIDSEYNNVGELMGIDDALMGEISELMGTMGAADKVRFLKKISSKPQGSRGSRAEFEKFFKEVPENVKAALISGELRLADYTIYSIKQVSSKTIKLFETQDDKETGLRNISNAKLPKNFVFLVSGIYVLAGVAEDPSDREKVKATDFKSVNLFPAIANAEFSLKSNKKQIIPDGNIIRKFITDNNHYGNLGYFKLDNPRLIKDDELIEFVIELGTMYGLDPKTFVYVGLDGTGTTP
ncbi:MAG: hypothetical protein Q8L81_05705 [Bacteroidota bacterium]|nr:hypothetical protein [Bacteroidota bacterium]